MKQIKDMPSSVLVTLDEESGVKYPVSGDFEISYEIELICFDRKSYLKTWPLRQRVMRANTQLMNDFENLFKGSEKAAAEEPEQEQDEVDVNAFKQMLLMCGFDAVAAMEEFKQFAIVGGFVKVTESITMNKERWAQVDEYTKEQILFTYLAHFIQPCVV